MTSGSAASGRGATSSSTNVDTGRADIRRSPCASARGDVAARVVGDDGHPFVRLNVEAHANRIARARQKLWIDVHADHPIHSPAFVSSIMNLTTALRSPPDS